MCETGVQAKGLVEKGMRRAQRGDCQKIVQNSLTPKGQCLSRCSVAMKGHHSQGNLYKRKHLIGAGLQLRRLVHCHHDRKHGSTHGAAAESCTPIHRQREGESTQTDRQTEPEPGPGVGCELSKPQSPPPKTYFFQQGHTCMCP